MTALPGIDVAGAALIKSKAAELIAVKAAEDEARVQREAENEARLRAEAAEAAASAPAAAPLEEGGVRVPPAGPAADRQE